ncbi:helix-turn-helix domain-containing protein [Noviherbaspirillum cavernae]|uniref:Helix-turn-helix domain-containing protein n=1 Tax=Noviherbaspirillum cavernae TaxID=2320862 RepID=A0A418X0Q7_9BURK|nr:helix-turn-helix domain-containing protein [Noviherbaspirillum cavernae]RJG06078.1 helix-turn-helix domain-containing protein [Noviherbaspirillum cavernae]
MKTIRPTSFPKDPFIDTTAVVAQAIKAARTQAGLRLADAALLARVSLQTLVDVEAGKPGVSLGKVLQIADAIGVSFFAIPSSRREQIRHQLAHLNEGTE